MVLHIYHLSGKKRVRFANHVLRVFGSGAYHAAVEVHGVEWSFGAKKSGTGVFSCPPTACSAHTYKKPYLMGYTQCNEAQTERLLEVMAEEWPGSSYELLQRNCTHFSGELCQRLGVGQIPSWVTSLAAAGARLEELAEEGHEAQLRKGKTDGGTVSGIVEGIRHRGREQRLHRDASFGSSSGSTCPHSEESEDEHIDDYKCGDYSRGCIRFCC